MSALDVMLFPFMALAWLTVILWPVVLLVALLTLGKNFFDWLVPRQSPSQYPPAKSASDAS